MEMTIKQLANELGVCKQTVNNAILQLNLQDTLHKVGNKYLLSETQILQIKSQIKTPKTSKSTKSTNENEDNEEKTQETTIFFEKLTKTPETSKSTKSTNENKDDEEKTQETTAFFEKSTKTSKTSKSTKSTKSTNEKEKSTISFLELQNEILREQLVIKDNQIRLLQEQIGQLTNAMENLTTALNAEQALHAGTIQKQLTEHSVMDQPSDVEQPKQKQGLFSRLFGRKES